MGAHDGGLDVEFPVKMVPLILNLEVGSVEDGSGQ